MWNRVERTADMKNTVPAAMTNILIALIITWFIIIINFAAVGALALPVFYLVTIIIKKQYAYSSAIYILAIISILVLVFLLSGVAIAIFDSIKDGTIIYARIGYLPMTLATAFMAVSLVLNIKLVKYSGEIRKERWLASGWKQNLPENANTKKPVHVASLVIGIVSIISFFGFIFMGIPCIICGTIGSVLSHKARVDYNSNTGMTLSRIGLMMGGFELGLSILIRFMG